MTITEALRCMIAEIFMGLAYMVIPKTTFEGRLFESLMKEYDLSVMSQSIADPRAIEWERLTKEIAEKAGR